jgi:hypothetical protein
MVGEHFSFDTPSDWPETREGGRHVYRGPGPGLQELIVQGTLLEGGEPTAEREGLLSQVVDNAIKALQSTLQDEELEIIKPLSPDDSLATQPAWTAVATTKDGTTLFCGAAFRGLRGVLLITFEADNAPDQMAVCRRILSSVRLVDS